MRGIWQAYTIAILLTTPVPMTVQAQGAADIDALNKQINQLYGQGKYAEATVIAQRALTLAERVLGKEHPGTLTCVNNLALLYQQQRRYGEAEPLYKRALEARERLHGKEHPNTLISVNNQASLYKAQGRYSEAEPLYSRALEAYKRVLGKEHPDTLRSMNSLASLYQDQGRYGEAEPLYRHALGAYERLLGKAHPDTLRSVNNLAELYQAQGRYSEAEPLYRRALDAYERVFGPEHPHTLTTLNNLASLYQDQGRYGEAEPLYKHALEAYERVLSKAHPDTLRSVNNLAALYQAQGRTREAEPLYRRALEASEQVFGPEHPHTLTILNNLALLYNSQGRYGEAEPLYKRALRARERVLGPEHPETLTILNNLALLYKSQGRYGEAEPLYKRALQAKERVLGPEHPETLTILNNLAFFYFVQRDWTRAAEFWRASTAGVAARTQRGALDTGQALTGKKKSEAEQSSGQFWGLVKAVYRLTPEGRVPDALATRKMFQTAQWALGSAAAQSLTQMAARGASGNLALAPLVRERQDLVEEWQKRDGLRNMWLGQAQDQRNPKAEAENQGRLTAIDTRLAAIDTRLAAEFPDYAALTSPAPLTAEEVQGQLRENEALVLFLDTPEWKPTTEETFIWVVTKTDLRWVRSDLGTAALAREVQALRCGLDEAAWQGPRCKELTGSDFTQPLPFDHARAHRLYKALFGEVEDLIKTKTHLLLVPSGPLTQLPFQVLVTTPPSSDDDRSAAWLHPCPQRASGRLVAQGAARHRASERGEEAAYGLRQSAPRRPWRRLRR